MTKIAIIYHSHYGHTRQLALAIKVGTEEAGGSADLLQIPETVSPQKLKEIGALKFDDPVVKAREVMDYDGYMFGIASKFQGLPAQWVAWWSSTGGLWTTSAFHGKFAGLFISSADQGGGQENVINQSMSILVRHGMLYVPLGYSHAFEQLCNMDEIHGGSPWGAGCITGDNIRRPVSNLELEIAEKHGHYFSDIVSRLNTA